MKCLISKCRAGFMKSMYKKRSLTRKLLNYVVLIGLVPLLYFGIVSIVSTTSTLNNDSIRFQTELVNQREKCIEAVMNDIENLAANLIGIDEINKAMQQGEGISTYDKLVTQAKIGYILSGYTNLSGLISIDIFSQSGLHYHVGDTLSASNINDELKVRLFNETANSQDYLYWSGIERNINLDSNYKMVIIAAKELDVNNGTQGLLVISYDPSVFNNMINIEQYSGYTIIMDSKNRIIYHPDQRYIGKSISAGIIKSMNADNGAFSQVIDGTPTIIAYTKTQKGAWTIATFMPSISIFDQSPSVTILLAFLLSALIFLIFLFGRILSIQVVQPIRKITETFRQLKSGDLEEASRLEIKTQDEIGELGQLFNSFIDAREDITLQKKLEKKLNEQNHELQSALDQLRQTQTHMIQQEKMAGIGQLAAGVAHEINNPLGYVSGNIDMLNDYFSRFSILLDVISGIVIDEESVEIIKSKHGTDIAELWTGNKIDLVRKEINGMLCDIREGISRISDIITGLKGFSRTNQIDEKTQFNLNEGIRMTLIVANNELKYNCNVHLSEGEIPDTYANGGQINQVLLNILINAVHAIKTKYWDRNGNIEIKTWANYANIYCSISDDGCGMTEAVKRRIFEPFFTTKPPGQGTGLGLGIAYDIIHHKHGGEIEVESTLGVGTCFTIKLPITNSYRITWRNNG